MKQMKYFIRALTVLATCLPLTAMAAGQEGNGGDGIYCSKNGKPSVLMLDIYEAQKIYGRKLDLGSAQLSTEEKVDLALTRLAKIDRARAQDLRNLANEFWQNTLLTEDDLIDLPDSGLGSVPAGCEIKQVAIQKAPIFPGAKLYTIDKKLWNLMNRDSQAALILHELTLNMVRDSNASYMQKQFRIFHGDTQRVRYFTGWVTSSEGASISLGDYAKILNLSALDAAGTYQGFNLNWSQKLNYENTEISGEPEFFDKGKTQIKSAYFNGRAALAVPLGSGGLVMKFNPTGQVFFYPNGKLEFINTQEDPSTHEEIQIPVASGQLIWPEYKENALKGYTEKFKFDENQTLINMTSHGDFTNSFAEMTGAFEITRSGNNYFVSSVSGEGKLTWNSQVYQFKNASIRLYENGKPAAISGISIVIKTIFGDLESTGFELYPNGTLKSLLKGSIDAEELTIKINGVDILLQGKNRISFHESGSILSAVMKNETAGLKDPAGKAVAIPARTRFNLDTQGAVTCVGMSCI